MVPVTGGMEARAHPVEYGAINLSSTDLIEHAGKGLVGALVIEPPGSTWTTDANSRLSATVTAPDTSFREHVTVLQDNLQLHYGSQCTPGDANLQCAVPNIATEGAGVAEDAEDSGQKAINYGAEPLWFRLGVTPDTETGDLNNNTDIHRVYANELVGGDPQTPVFTAKAGQPVRIRLLEPGGHARAPRLHRPRSRVAAGAVPEQLGPAELRAAARRSDGVEQGARRHQSGTQQHVLVGRRTGGDDRREPLRPVAAARGRTLRGHRRLSLPGLRRLRQLPGPLGDPQGHALTARAARPPAPNRVGGRAVRVTATRVVTASGWRSTSTRRRLVWTKYTYDPLDRTVPRTEKTATASAETTDFATGRSVR